MLVAAVVAPPVLLVLVWQCSQAETACCQAAVPVALVPVSVAGYYLGVWQRVAFVPVRFDLMSIYIKMSYVCNFYPYAATLPRCCPM